MELFFSKIKKFTKKFSFCTLPPYLLKILRGRAMTTEVDNDSEDFDFFSDYMDWTLENGLWNGVPVHWEQAEAFQSETAKKIAEKLFSHDPNSVDFMQMAAELARMGTSDESRFLLEKEIEELRISPDGMVVPVGFGKVCSRFWKKHKKEILIGIGIVAAVTTVVVVAAYASGALAGILVGGAKAGLDEIGKEDEKNRKAPEKPNNSLSEGVVFQEKSIVVNDQTFSQEDILTGDKKEEFISSLRSQMEDTLNAREAILSYRPWEINQWGMEPSLPQNSIQTKDFRFIPLEMPRVDASKSGEEGRRSLKLYVNSMPGINNTPEEAADNAKYLSTLGNGIDVNVIPNKSHGAIIDIMEAGILNYAGFSPNTAAALGKSWTAFHEETKHTDPEVKLLQFCHSQGSIHVKNQLDRTPKEIADRIILVAIAPAALFSENICAENVRLASKRDFVPHLEGFLRGTTDSPEDGISESTKQAWKNQELVIVLEPHPDADLFDHSFQSPTFREEITRIINRYIVSGGRTIKAEK
jgi:hypothetical protein